MQVQRKRERYSRGSVSLLDDIVTNSPDKLWAALRRTARPLAAPLSLSLCGDKLV